MNITNKYAYACHSLRNTRYYFIKIYDFAARHPCTAALSYIEEHALKTILTIYTERPTSDLESTQQCHFNIYRNDRSGTAREVRYLLPSLLALSWPLFSHIVTRLGDEEELPFFPSSGGCRRRHRWRNHHHRSCRRHPNEKIRRHGRRPGTGGRSKAWELTAPDEACFMASASSGPFLSQDFSP